MLEMGPIETILYKCNSLIAAKVSREASNMEFPNNKLSDGRVRKTKSIPLKKIAIEKRILSIRPIRRSQ
jgi:hypothetical protein